MSAAAAVAARVENWPRAAGEARPWWLFVPGVVAAAWLVSYVAGFDKGLLILDVFSLGLILCGFQRQMVVLGVTLLTVLDGATRSVFLTGGLWRFNTFTYVLLLLLFLYRRQLLARWPAPLWWLAFLTGMLALGLLVTSDTEAGVQHILSTCTAFALFAVFRQARMDGELWGRVALTAGLAAAAGGFVYYFGRGLRPAMNPNVFALLPLTALFAHCLSAAASRMPARLAVTAGLTTLSVVNVCWVFLSGSRGGLFTALLCLGYLLLSARSTGHRLLYPAVSVGGAVLLMAASPSGFEFGWRRVEKLFRSDRNLSERTSGRTEIAAVGWDLFEQHPLGIGTGAFAREFSARSLMSKHFRAGTRREAHSAWVKILAENGVPGILVFAAFVGSFGVAGLRRGADVRRVAVFTSLALAVAFLSTEFSAKSVWFLAAGCALLLPAKAGEHQGNFDTESYELS